MMKKLAFDPATHGFHFRNDFVNHPIPGVGITTSGLCGGMALAAARYWMHGIAVPTHVPGDFPDGSPAGVPPEGSPLQSYIYGCQMESYGPLGVLSAANWVTVGVSTDQQFDWSVHEFDNVRAAIDAGSPVVIGLRQLVGGPAGHQVLAYGYDETTNGIWVYDSNHPNEEHLLCVDTVTRSLVYDAAGDPAWSSLFVTGCSMAGPAPTYIDLGLGAGITVSAADPVPSGGPVSIDVTVHNFGFRDAHVNELFVYVRDPLGRNCDALLGGGDNDPSPIPPGGERRLQRDCPHFGTDPGTYTVGVSFLSEQDRWVRVNTPLGGTRSEVPVRVAPAASGSAPDWASLGGVLNAPPTIVANQDGRLEVFGVGTDYKLWHRAQRSAASVTDFTGWEQLPGDATFTGTPCGILNHWLKLEIFARGRDGSMWHRWQNNPNVQTAAEWSPWTGLGNGLAGDPSVICNRDDRLEVFAVHQDGIVRHIYQRWFDPFGAPWSGWEPLGTRRFAGRVAVNRDGSGRLWALARSAEDSSIWAIHQTAPGGAWTDWTATNGTGSDPVLGCNADGRVEGFVRGTDGHLWHLWQSAPDSDLSGWDALHNVGPNVPVLDSGMRPAAWNEGDGTLAVAAVGTDQQAAMTARIDSDPWWSDYQLVGRGIASEIQAAAGAGNSGLVALGAARDVLLLTRTP